MRQVYRATPKAYAVWGMISGALAVLGLAVFWPRGPTWWPLLVPLLGYALVAMWLARFRLAFEGGGVRVTIPFRGTRQLAREDVLSIECAWEMDRSRSPLTLCIRTSPGEEVRFNAKVFSTEAIERLLAFAQSKSPG